jgi:uncharacterized protein GlcG (DUF336 family)
MIRRVVKVFGFFACLLVSGAAQAANLTVADVQSVVAQAVNESRARGVASAIAVSDRVGNVLAVYNMIGANRSFGSAGEYCGELLGGIPVGCIVITSDPAQINGAIGKPNINDANNPGLDGLSVPGPVAAIAKAITGAYLSSGGNAFTTRTANQIVQEHFNPQERFAPSGPLFGVQFSQLPCSDLNINTNTVTNGPKRSPLGLSADPGGLPLYKNGEMVGGVGVISDGIYSVDLRITDFDTDNDELIALAATRGFEPPADIKGNRITVEGKTFRFTDRDSRSLLSNSAAAPSFASLLDSSVGALTPITSYFSGSVVAGQTFGEGSSGIRQDVSGVYAPLNAFVLVDQNDQARFPPQAGSEGTANSLTAAEVTTILRNALTVAFRARAQIRRPLGSHAQVSMSVVDTNGKILGIVRTPDGPIFGTDVSLQKARTAAFFSNPDAAQELINGGQSRFVSAVQAFIGPTALTDGIAFADRSGGNLSRPYYPDGIDGSPNGPFSEPIAAWSPFNVGLQFQLIFANLGAHVGFLLDDPDTLPVVADTVQGCTALDARPQTGVSRLPNGIQIFPGSVPIYRGSTLIGGLGVSGDGVDQDDMISFLGLHNAGLELGNGVGNAPRSIRADNLVVQGARLRYVNCPFLPFLDTNEQNVCAGK